MQIKVLIDNSPNPSSEYFTEHGLSILFETNNQKWLMDMGASGLFAMNARQLDINLNQVDYVVLSHAHYDHAGGLEVLLKENEHAKILLSGNISDNSYYSKRNDGKRCIGINYGLTEQFPERIIRTSGNRWFTPEVAILCDFVRQYPKPLGNQMLFHGDHPDTFDHEQAVLVLTEKGGVVFTGCAHNGLLNILQTARLFAPDVPIIAAIGGTHLINPKEGHTFESTNEIRTIAETLRNNFPEIKLITGHCTGSLAHEILSDVLGERLDWFYSGYGIDL